jgi:dCTP diphosphatase
MLPGFDRTGRRGVCHVNDDQTTVAELKRLVAEFVAQRDWQQFHDPKNLSMAIAIEAAELMEHFQWLRSDELAEATSPEHLNAIQDELADVAAFLLSLANVLEIDLSAALQRKMAKNADKYPTDRFRGRFR